MMKMSKICTYIITFLCCIMKKKKGKKHNMKIALKINDDGSRDLVHAASLSDEDKQFRFICSECGRRAFLNISRINGKENWFASNEHTPECPLAEGGRVYRTPEGQEFHLEDAMRHVDHPIGMMPPPTITPPTDSGDEDEIEDEFSADNIMLFEPDRLHTCSTIYRAASALRTDDMMLEEVTVGDFLVDSRTIERARSTELEGIKMFVLRRCSPKDMVPPITTMREYVLLRDPKTEADTNAIYVQIKFAEKTHDKQFRDMLFGDKKRGIKADPRKYIVAMGRVTRIADPNYIIYRLSPVSSARLCFIKKTIW